MPAPTQAQLGPPAAPQVATRARTTTARTKLEIITMRVFWAAWANDSTDQIIGRNTVMMLRIVSIGAIIAQRGSKNVATTVGATAPRPTPSGDTTRPISAAARTAARGR